MLIAIEHLLGAILAVLGLSIILFIFSSWLAARSQKRVLEETSVRLGVAVDDLNNEDMAPKLLQISSERFSSDLLSNRISDLCGSFSGRTRATR